MKTFLSTQEEKSKKEFNPSLNIDFSVAKKDAEKKKTLQNFSNDSWFFKLDSFGWKSKKLMSDFEKTTWKKYDSLTDTAESDMNSFLQDKYWITLEEHQKATTTALERWATSTFKMAVWWIKNVVKSWVWFWSKLWTAVWNTDFWQSLKQSDFWQSVKPFTEKSMNFLEKNFDAWNTTISQDFLNVWEWLWDIAVSVWLPLQTFAFNTLQEAEWLPWNTVRWFWELLVEWWKLVNKFPWLSNFRDTLNERDQQRFDMFIWWWMFWHLSWTKVRWVDWKLSAKSFTKSLVNPKNIIDTFLDLDNLSSVEKATWWTLLWEVWNLVWQGIKWSVDFLQKKNQKIEQQKTLSTNFLEVSKQNSKILQKFDETPEYQQKQITLQEDRKVFDENQKIEQQKKQKDAKIQQDIITHKIDSEKPIEISNFNKQRPEHLYFKSIKDLLVKKDTENTIDWDSVVLKDWSFWEISIKHWKYTLNFPKTYTSKKIERDTKTISKDDIVSWYKVNRITNESIWKIMDNDENYTKKVYDNLDDFVSKKQQEYQVKDDKNPYKYLRDKYRNLSSKDIITSKQNVFDLRKSLLEEIEWIKDETQIKQELWWLEKDIQNLKRKKAVIENFDPKYFKNKIEKDTLKVYQNLLKTLSKEESKKQALEYYEKAKSSHLYSDPKDSQSKFLPKLVREFNEERKIMDEYNYKKAKLSIYDTELEYLDNLFDKTRELEEYRDNLPNFDIYKAMKVWILTKAEWKHLIAQWFKKSWNTLFSWDTLFSSIEQVKKVSKEMYSDLMHASVQWYENTAHILPLLDSLKKEFAPWLFSKIKDKIKWKKMTLEQKTVKFYNKVQSWVEMANPELRRVFDNIKKMFEIIWFEMWYRKNYFPQVVKDYDWLIAFFNNTVVKEIPSIKDIFKAYEEQYWHKLTDTEKADILVFELQKQDPFSSPKWTTYFSSAEKRNIKNINSKIVKFYHDPYTATQMYFQKAFNNLEMIQALWYEWKFDVKEDLSWMTKPSDPKVAKILWYDEKSKASSYSIKNTIDEKIKSWEISYEDWMKLQKYYLWIYTNPIAKNKIQKLVPTYKSILDVMNVARFSSALTNFKDLWVAMYKFWYLNTLSSFGRSFSRSLTPQFIDKYFNQKLISMEDFWLNWRNMEYTYDMWKTKTEKVIKWIHKAVMEWSWFSWFDRVWKETSINASLKSWQDFAQNKNSEWKISSFIFWKQKMKQLKDNWLSDIEIEQFLKDVKEWKLTYNVKYVLLDDLYWLQAVDKKSAPANMNWDIWISIFYKYKTNQLKKIELMKKEFFDFWNRKGVWDWMQRFARIINFVIPMILVWMTVDEAKDLINNRDSTITDVIFSNALELTWIINKYQFFLLKEWTEIWDFFRYREQVAKYIEKWKDISWLEYESQKSVIDNIVWASDFAWSLVWFPLTPFLTARNEFSSYVKTVWTEKDYKFFKESYSVSRIPLVWDLYYWNFWKWQTDTIKKNKVRERTPWFFNRTLWEIIDPNVNFDWEKLYYAKVVEVLDWDTLKIKLSTFDKIQLTSLKDLLNWWLNPVINKDWTMTIRFHWSDTSETVDPDEWVQFMWKKASTFTKQLVWQKVLIQADYMSASLDNRWTRFLWVVKTLPETTNLLYNIPYLRNAQNYEDFNAKLIELWLAKVTWEFKFSHKDLYYSIQKKAQEKWIWVWDKQKEEQYYREHPDVNRQRTYYFKKN
jgi:hypothetical protein